MSESEVGGFVCAGCGEKAASMEGTCDQCGAMVALDGRYGLQSIVGRGAAGTTWKALDGQTDEAVAVKELPIRPGTPLTVRERMHREARVLGELEHDRIPRYIDDLEAGSGRHRSFYVVQSFVEGPTLAALAQSKRFSQDEIIGMLDEVLAILEYLHGLAPPVIHRDLKPGNVIRRASDGALVLIDFGAVKDVAGDPRTGGSTIAGTYGYMAPEQFRGLASPATDLYGVGAMAVALLSRRDLIDLVGPDHRLKWRDAVTASPGLIALIERLLADDPSDRPTSAKAVRAALARVDAGEAAVSATGVAIPDGLPPSAMERLRGALSSDEPIMYIAQPKTIGTPAGARAMQMFAVPWTAFALFWMVMASGLGVGETTGFGAVFSLFGLPFVGIGIAMLTSPYWMKKVRANTVQVVTDRQALIVRGKLGWPVVEGLLGSPVKRYRGLSLAQAERNTDGHGLDAFVFEYIRGNKGSRRPVGFEGVEDGDRVAKLLRRAAKWSG